MGRGCSPLPLPRKALGWCCQLLLFNLGPGRLLSRDGLFDLLLPLDQVEFESLVKVSMCIALPADAVFPPSLAFLALPVSFTELPGDRLDSEPLLFVSIAGLGLSCLTTGALLLRFVRRCT